MSLILIVMLFVMARLWLVFIKITTIFIKKLLFFIKNGYIIQKIIINKYFYQNNELVSCITVRELMEILKQQNEIRADPWLVQNSNRF